MALLLPVIFPGTLSYSYAAAQEPQVGVNVNGDRIITDAPAFIKDERTLVPLRGIFEKLGAEIEWIDDEKRVNVNYKDINVSLQIDNKEASVNGVTSTLDVAPIISNDRTMIPLRFISENIGMKVGWIPEACVATITDPSYFESIPSKTVLGFTTNDYKGDQGSLNSLLQNIGSINSIATFSYRVDDSGNLLPSGLSQSEAIKAASANGIKPLVLIHNYIDGRFDKDLSHSVLTNAQVRSALVNSIIATMGKEQYSGVNIDIENIYWYDRPYYTSFIKELKEALAPLGFLTTVSIPAKTYDSYRNDNWGGAFDYEAIGKHADQALIMTYDEHYAGGAAGPIASYPWVEKVVKYASSKIPSQKILLGIPGYGYDWSNSGSKVFTYKNADKYMESNNAQPSWDEDKKSPYFSYYKNGVSHIAWYESSRSISSKLELVQTYNLGGIGIWRLGYDDSSFWNTIKEAF